MTKRNDYDKTFDKRIAIEKEISIVLNPQIYKLAKPFNGVWRKDGLQFETPEQLTSEQKEQLAQLAELCKEKDKLEQQAKQLKEQEISEILEFGHPGNLWLVTTVYLHYFPREQYPNRTLKDVEIGHEEIRKWFKRYDSHIDYTQWTAEKLPE